MILTVCGDVDGIYQLIELQVDEILYFEFSRKRNMTEFHTKDNSYFLPGSVKHWLEVLNASGAEFDSVDRNSAVHLPKIKHVDRIFRNAYFEENISKDSKRCTISITNIDLVLSYLKK